MINKISRITVGTIFYLRPGTIFSIECGPCKPKGWTPLIESVRIWKTYALTKRIIFTRLDGFLRSCCEGGVFFSLILLKNILFYVHCIRFNCRSKHCKFSIFIKLVSDIIENSKNFNIYKNWLDATAHNYFLFIFFLRSFFSK